MQARFVAVAIMMRNFDAATTTDLLERWERSSFRLFGIGRLDARSYNREYTHLGHAIAAGLDAKAAGKAIDVIGEDFDLKERISLKSYWDEW
ncbi:hypothetical protein [Acetobacter indonesiensis]|uniref:Uncharacterized protein n=1 Tax=Acetobacter indonesiensis TaxID=104101 RepID=A0A252AR13_9PROT|nr:hypothetical protein [Acetobacter indonesiensis]OUI92261.1 hypothetical protein HK17_10595 [Acetobacter indonesiensis]